MLTTHTATRYVTPLREGGSLPAILETEDGGLWVVKFLGAGQGARALVAELIVGALAEALDLRVPERALIDLDESFGRTERDPEIQDLLKASRGLNVGLRYLDGAFNYDPVAVPEIDPAEAARIVWLDAFTLNVDRTPRNPNLLLWRDGAGERALWLIDHGAALYLHHDWPSVDDTRRRTPFAMSKDHVLLPLAGPIPEADAYALDRLTPDLIDAVLASVPDALLLDQPEGQSLAFDSPDAFRDAYRRLLTARLDAPRAFVDEAERARTTPRPAAPKRLSYRR